MKSTLIKLHTAVFLWGFTGVLGKLILLNEGLLVWYRIFITLATLLVVFQFTKSLQKISNQRIKKLLFIGCIIAFHWVFFYGSIKYSNVSIALVCVSTISFFTALLEPLIIKTKLSAVSVMLSLLGVAGVALIFHFDNKFRTGIIIGLISSFLSALFTVLNKKNVHIANTQTVLFYELLGGFIFLTILFPFYNYYFPSKSILPTLTDVGWLLILSWFCTIIAMGLSLQALQKVSAFTQNLTLNLEPVYGIVLAFIIYNEQKDLSQSFYWGMLLITLSVVLQMVRITSNFSKISKI
jgi:drug/metabolite transporter (DMT)-like permease